MYRVRLRGHLQGQTRDNSNTHFFQAKKEHIYVCSYIISAVYTCRIISCLKELTLFYHINTPCGMHISLKINEKKNKIKMKHVY